MRSFAQARGGTPVRGNVWDPNGDQQPGASKLRHRADRRTALFSARPRCLPLNFPDQCSWPHKGEHR